MVDQQIQNALQGLERNRGATKEAVSLLLSYFGSKLPDEYLGLLRYTNGFRGGFDGEGKYVDMWSAAFLVSRNQEFADSETREFLPGLVILGTNGGSENFGIDTREYAMGKTRYVLSNMLDVHWHEVFFLGSSLVELFEYFRMPELFPIDRHRL